MAADNLGQAGQRDTESTILSESEQELLRHETLISALIQLRTPKPVRKPIWLAVIESSLTVTAVSILLGTYGAAYLTASISDQSRKNEQALTDYRLFLDKREDALQDLYKLVGRCIAASEDYIAIAGPASDLNHYAADDRPSVRIQLQKIVDARNEADEEWTRERARIGLTMDYFFHGNAKVLASWQAVERSTTKYRTAAFDYANQYNRNPGTAPDNASLLSARKQLDDDLNVLSTALSESRSYRWEAALPSKQ